MASVKKGNGKPVKKTEQAKRADQRERRAGKAAQIKKAKRAKLVEQIKQARLEKKAKRKKIKLSDISWSNIKKYVTEYLIIRGPLNYNLLFVILFLNIFGLIMMYSASYNKSGYDLLKKQFTFVLLGMVFMWVVSKINYHFWIKLGWAGFVGSIILILLLKTPLGDGALGAVRWIKIGPLRFQAAEPVKLFMMVFLAMYITKYGVQQMRNRIHLIVCSLLVVGLAAIISENVSTAVIILGLCYICIMVSDKKMWPYMAVVLGVLVFAGFFLLLVEFVIPPSPGEVRIKRIRSFMHPNDYIETTGLQAMQALYAIGSGGFWGRGLGQSLVKFKLPEPHNDYILAIVCEEMGVFGALILMFLFGYLLVQIVLIQKDAVDAEGRLFCVALFAQIAIQTVLNIMVVVSWFPTTGVSLPFISYGGASAVFLMVELGVVFNIDTYSKNQRYRKEAIKAVDEMEKKRLLERQMK